MSYACFSNRSYPVLIDCFYSLTIVKLVCQYASKFHFINASQIRNKILEGFANHKALRSHAVYVSLFFNKFHLGTVNLLRYKSHIRFASHQKSKNQNKFMRRID